MTRALARFEIAFALLSVAACDTGGAPAGRVADAAAGDALAAQDAPAHADAGRPDARPSGDAEADRGPPPAPDAQASGDAEARRPDVSPSGDATPPRPDADAPRPDAGNSAEDEARQARFFAAEAVLPVEIELPEASEAELRANPHGEYVSANVTVDGIRLENVGLKLKGGRGSFRELGQKAAFKIDLDHAVPGQRLAGLEKLTFNNMIQDATQMRERLGSLAFGLLGLPAGRVGYVEISVNGTNYGLYAHVETLDEAFLARNFPGDADGDLYEGFDDLDLWIRDLARFDQDAGDAEDRADLRGLITAMDRARPADLDAVVGARVDLEQARRFFAAEILVGHWDGYAQLRNNYYLYNRPSDGRFVFLPSGMDQAFQRTNSAFAGPGRLFRMCVDWLPCRLPYAETVRASADILSTYDWETEIRRLAALLEEPFSRDRKTPTRPAQRLEAIDALSVWMAGQPRHIADAMTCLDPAQDRDGDGTLACAGDCNDADAAIYPGAFDACDDGGDEDCSGFTDDGQDCPLCREAPVAGSETTFLVCHRPVRFSVAGDLCASMGAVYASIHDDAEQAAVAEAALARRPTRYWLGALDTGTPGMFRWLDETPFDYALWAEGQPDNNGGYEHCAALNAAEGGTWGDYYSGFYFPFICRRPAP